MGSGADGDDAAAADAVVDPELVKSAAYDASVSSLRQKLRVRTRDPTESETRVVVAVRAEAARIFASELAPDAMRGEPAYGNRDADDAIAGSDDGRAGGGAGGALGRKKSFGGIGASGVGPGRSLIRSSSFEGGGGGSNPPDSETDDDADAHLAVGAEILNKEVRDAAQAYVDRREREFWRDAKLRFPSLMEEELRRATAAIDPSRGSSGAAAAASSSSSSQTQTQTQTHDALAFMTKDARAKLHANAKRSAQRTFNNELLHARLRAWPRDRVLRAVEAGYKRAFAERAAAIRLESAKERARREKEEQKRAMEEMHATMKAKRAAAAAAAEAAEAGKADEDDDGGGGASADVVVAAAADDDDADSAREVAHADAPEVAEPEPAAADAATEETEAKAEEETAAREADANDAEAAPAETPAEEAPAAPAATATATATATKEDPAETPAEEARPAAEETPPPPPPPPPPPARKAVGADWNRAHGLEWIEPATVPPTPAESYVAACRAAGIVPQTAATRGLATDSDRCELRHRALGDAAVAAVAAALRNPLCVSLTRLDLRDNDVRDAGFVAIARGLTHNSVLTHLDLSDNPGPKLTGVEALRDALDPNCARRLKDSHCALTTLRLSNVGLDDVCGAKLGEVFADNSSVKSLDLSRNQLGPLTSAALASSVDQNQGVVELNVSRNNFGARCAARFAALVKVNATIRILDISHNGLEDEGTETIGLMLGGEVELKSLDLSATRMGERGAAAVAASLSRNESLESLHVGRNPTSRKAIDAIVNAANARNKTAAGKKAPLLVTLEGARLSSIEADVVAAARRAEEARLEEKNKGKKGGGKPAAAKAPPPPPTGKNAPPPPPPPPPPPSAYDDAPFDVANPDGRHVLRLDHALERRVALDALALEEKVSGTVVNVRYEGVPVRRDPIGMGWADDATLPEEGVLSLDVVTRRGADASPAAAPASDAAFRVALDHVSTPTMTPRERLAAIALAARSHCFTGAQAATLVRAIEHGETRVEAAATVAPRTVASTKKGGLDAILDALTADEQARSISHWSPYDRVGVVNADP